MRKQDWSLVLFTTLSQLSVGMILGLTALIYLSGDTGVILETGISLKNPVLLALVLVVVATTLSLLHLGNPKNAPRALSNLSGSWLSREILALGIYSLSLLIIVVIAWRLGSNGNFKHLMMLSVMPGLALIWMMIRIYTVATIPAWNSWYTPLSFISTAICLGFVVLLILAQVGFVYMAGPVVNVYTVSLVITLLIETASAFLHQSQLVKMNTGIENLVFDRGLYYKIYSNRMAVLILSILALSVTISNPEIIPGNSLYTWVPVWATLIFTQEIMGRFLFYSSYFRVGI